jgi:hypothetical protein
MPAMVRPKGKTAKIAYDLVGKPGSLRSRKTREQKRIDSLLTTGEAYRAR